MELQGPTPSGTPGTAAPGAALRRRFGAPRFLRGAPPARGGVSWALVALCVVGLGLLAASTLLGENGLATQRRLAREREEASTEVDRLRTQRRELQARIEALRSNPAALERLAREKYGMKRPGQSVLEFVGDEQLTAGRTASMVTPAAGLLAGDGRAAPAPTRMRPNLQPAYPAPPADDQPPAGPTDKAKGTTPSTTTAKVSPAKPKSAAKTPSATVARPTAGKPVPVKRANAPKPASVAKPASARPAPGAKAPVAARHEAMRRATPAGPGKTSRLP